MRRRPFCSDGGGGVRRGSGGLGGGALHADQLPRRKIQRRQIHVDCEGPSITGSSFEPPVMPPVVAMAAQVDAPGPFDDVRPADGASLRDSACSSGSSVWAQQACRR